jgi:hypothetical protein
MPVCDIYTAGASLTLSGTSQTPILQLIPASTKRAWVVGVRVSIGTTAAAAGNNVLFVVAGNTTTTGTEATGTAVIAPNDPAAPAALTLPYNTWATAPTANNVVWQMELPQTTGSSWEEFPPLGYEWGVPVTAHKGIAVFATASVSTSTPVYAELVFGE